VHYGRHGHPTGSCVVANPTGVTTFLAEDRKALLGILGFFLGFSSGWIVVLEGGASPIVSVSF
jgi:hypothetical protein